MKKAIICVSMAVLLLLLCACGSIYSTPIDAEVIGDNEESQGLGEINQEETEVYYTVGMHIVLPYWQEHRWGLEAAAEELGVQVVFTGENGSDALRQIDIFEQVVSKDPAGILVCPIDNEAMKEPINRAMGMGIPVICIDNDSPNSDRLTYFGTNNYRSGCLAGDILGKELGGTGDVAILTIPGIYSLDERQRGFEECIAQKYPGINVVAVLNDEADPSYAANIAVQMFEENPSVAGIFGADAASGVGAAIALSEIGKLGDVKVVAFDKDAEVLELVEKGDIEATLVQRTFAMSYFGLKFLYDYNHNVNLKIDDTVTMMPDTVDTGIIVVTKENVGGFY